MKSSTTARHVLVALISLALVYAFAVVHGHWSPMHRWNRATADAALLLLTFTMAIGPGARLWPRLRGWITLRRETGIYAVILALAHTTIILEGWVQWSFARLFGMEFHPTLESYVMVQHGFGLANLIGIVALTYGFALMITSNDISTRFLGGSVWKFLHGGVTVLWALVVIHTAYFLFMHFLDFHRPTPDPNPLQWPFLGLVILVLAVRSAAFIQTWRLKRSSGRRQTEA